jgi:hypothetical protein
LKRKILLSENILNYLIYNQSKTLLGFYNNYGL